jgi:hypothetical protein
MKVNMKVKILILLLVIGVKSKAQSYPFTLPDNIEATININTGSQEVFNNLLLGTNIHHFTSDTEKDFVNKFNPISVRFPHGLWANWHDWRRDVSRVFGAETFIYKQGVNETPREQTIDFLANLKIFDNNNIKVGIDGLTSLNTARKSSQGKGYNMMWTFNMSADGPDFNNGSPESIARYEDLISRGFEVKDVEMGNENFYPGQRSSIIPNSEDYIARAKSMSAALKAKDPSIKVSIPLLRRNSWADPNWNADLTADKTYFDAVTIHTYVGSDPDNAANSDEAYGTALTARKHLLASITDYPHQVVPEKPIWLTEWGVKSGGPNAVSALGAIDCFLMMSENQDIFQRANWFSTNGKLNSMLVWETYLDSQNREKERIKYPLEKTLFGSAYEITRSVLENSILLDSDVEVPNLVDGVKSISARVVWKDDKATILVLNLTNQDVPFNIGIDGGLFNDAYVHKAIAFSSMDEERTVPFDVSPLTLVNEGIDQIILPKFSINTITLNSLNIIPSTEIPANNFKIQTVSETCMNKNNGKIIVEAIQNRNYNISLDGIDYSFTNNLTIENLNPGNYNVCITINGEEFEQCFDVIVDGGASISGKMSIVKNKVVVDIEEGSGPYSVYKNGKVLMTTYEKHFELTVDHEDQIEVKGKADCQGVLSKSINMLKNIKAYPNPTRGMFDIYIPADMENVDLKVYNIYSQLISNKQYPITGGKVNVDISDKPLGVYFVQVGSKEVVTIKIIKQ